MGTQQLTPLGYVPQVSGGEYFFKPFNLFPLSILSMTKTNLRAGHYGTSYIIMSRRLKKPSSRLFFNAFGGIWRGVLSSSLFHFSHRRYIRHVHQYTSSLYSLIKSKIDVKRTFFFEPFNLFSLSILSMTKNNLRAGHYDISYIIMSRRLKKPSSSLFFSAFAQSSIGIVIYDIADENATIVPLPRLTVDAL